jgi:hypothetical protein
MEVAIVTTTRSVILYLKLQVRLYYLIAPRSYLMDYSKSQIYLPSFTFTLGVL